jgi:hypothetical protein
MALIEGGPNKPGPFTFRLKFPANYRIPAHRHPRKTTVTVISGTFHMGHGDKLDTANGKVLPAGSIFEMPATLHHFGWASEETIIQHHGIGPFNMQYLNPADDPRQKQNGERDGSPMEARERGNGYGERRHPMTTHRVVSREEWIATRVQHLAREKELTRPRDQLSQERRELPWVKVDKPYVFEGPNGKESLADLFEGRSQLIVQHFMFDPSWDEGCKSCSFWTDNFNGIDVHLRGALQAGLRVHASGRRALRAEG